MSTKVLTGDDATAEILETYERLGLATQEARSEFTQFAATVRRVQFDVVTSTSSQPFDR